MLCEYGCGQEAKYQFKNGKWCCSESWNSCPATRKKHSLQLKEKWKELNSKYNSKSYKENQSIKMKESHKNPNSGLNSISCKEKKSNTMKNIWKDSDNIYNSISCKEKKSNSMKKAHKEPNSKYNSKLYKENHSNTMKEIWRNPESEYNSVLFRENQSKKMKESHKDSNSGFNSNSCKEKKSNIMKELHKDPNSIFNTELYKEKQSNGLKKAWKDPNNKLRLIKLSIEKINKKYPLFSKIEKMRYNPNKPSEKEIQVRCKNHNCKNSKEKGGWFTPNAKQIQDRKNNLENEGIDNSYFYCCQKCKDTCILYRAHGDPYRNTNKPYTSAELDTFNKLVLKRDNEVCYYCSEHHATIVHHLRPQKLEPFFALDPDYAVSVCGKCHYKYGHPTGSEYSTGNLAKIVCSVESQKFLNQTLENI